MKGGLHSLSLRMSAVSNRCILGYMTKEVIGVIGTIGAGKDTAGNYIARKLDIPRYQISTPLKEICAERGVELTRENLVALGTELAAEKGEAYLAEYIVSHTESDKLIITGMRQLAQIVFLQSTADLTLIAIDADPSVRYERTKAAAAMGEAKTLDEFIANEHAENSPPNVQRLFECMKLADYHLTNNGSPEDLYSEIDCIIAPKNSVSEL